MKTNYSIRNFRVFDNAGVSLDIKPITILTGCNSSGKSSVVKSLLLLCDFFKQLKSAKENSKKISLSSCKLDFTKRPHNSLGKFSKVVNCQSNEKNVTLSIKVHSYILAQDMTVEMTFAADENDDNTNGYITSVTIRNENDIVVYSSSKDKNKNEASNLYALFPDFLRFTSMQHLIRNYQNAWYDMEISGKISQEEFNTIGEQLKKSIDEYISKYGRTSIIDLNHWNNANRNYGSFLANASNENCKIFGDMYEKEIVCYLPIFNKFNCSKEEAIAFIKQHIIKTDDKALAIVLSKIIVDFEQSEYDNFIQYFKSKETSYYSNFSHRKFFFSSEKPRLFIANESAFVSQEICFNPYYREVVASFDLEPQTKEEQEEEIIKRERKIKEWESKPLSFEMLFEALANLSEADYPQNFDYHNSLDGVHTGYSSKTEWLFFKFIEKAIEEIVVDATPTAISYVSSSIINIQRLYPLESIDEFTQLIKKYLAAKVSLDKQMSYTPGTFMNKWVKEFGIGDRISIKVDDEGLGATIRLHKTKEDKEGSLLADNGYGITQLCAIFLNIEVEIMRRKIVEKIADNTFDPCPSQEKIEKVCSEVTIAIEEPEIHLHPSYQSMLTEMFYDAYKQFDIHFIVETHSEYLIRKSQLIVADMKFTSNDEVAEKSPFATYYIPKDGIPYSLGYRKDGKFKEQFGTGFFDEASNLAFELL